MGNLQEELIDNANFEVGSFVEILNNNDKIEIGLVKVKRTVEEWDPLTFSEAPVRYEYTIDWGKYETQFKWDPFQLWWAYDDMNDVWDRCEPFTGPEKEGEIQKREPDAEVIKYMQ